MYTVLSSTVRILIASTLRQPFAFNYVTVARFSWIVRRNKCSNINMATTCFKGHLDHYNGVTIHSNEEFCEDDIFGERLEASLQQWVNEQKRAIWFRVDLQHASWVPVLVKQGFKFHHAREDFVMLYLWLTKVEESNIPSYAHTNLGVGAFVFDEKTNKLLVIKEKYTNKNPFWKLPGGFVEPGEDISDAVQREVLEETGIKTRFQCLISLRHGHGYAFGCSDIYIVAFLVPETFDIQQCNREISECQWMNLSDYANHSEVHTNNRVLANNFIEFLQHRMGITLDKAIHPITMKPISVYSVSNIK